MTLAQYLEREKISHAAFAQRIGRSQRIVSYWVDGMRNPRVNTIKQVEKATKGKVRYQDWARGLSA